MLEYKIYLSHINTDRELDNVCNIAFQSGKGACGCGFHKDGDTEFYICGTFSDMVRVFSALRNNGYKPKAKRQVYGDNN